MGEFKICTTPTDDVNGKKKVCITQKQCNDTVTAVFVDAVLEATESNYLDSECGVIVSLSLNKNSKGYMANYRSSEFWSSPFFGKKFEDIPDETQLLVVELENGEFCALVPVVNDRYKCVLCGGNKGLTVKLFSWYEQLAECHGLAFVYAIGEKPIKLIHDCVKEALRILNTGVCLREERRYPEVFEYLGWCSWDSMQIRVSEKSLLKKCEEFKQKNIPVKWIIIDDMWAEIRDFYGQEYHSFSEMIQLMHKSKLYHYEADPYRFPNGLANCVSKIKDYGMRVGIWYPTTGYWDGIDPKGTAYELLKEYLIQTDSGTVVPDWHRENSYLYYKTIHDYFRRCDIDFVKIDNQSMTRRYYKKMAPVGQVAKEYHDGLEASVGEHFDNVMINCMGTASEDMWSRTISPISRCSGDFMPENKEWFSKHLLQCAYNSLIQGQFYWCDWDMWWTDDAQAIKNSMVRAISGGPIYISDKLERSRKEVLEPLILSDGKILRCDRPCMPTKDCITVNPTTSGKAFKLQNKAGEYGFMAILNIDENEMPVDAEISAELIDDLASVTYVVYEYFSQETCILKSGESFFVNLKNANDYKFYIFAPVKNGFAAIGRIDKFLAPKTIQYVCGQKIILKEEGPYAYVKDGKLIIR